jgi:predicted ATPase
MTQHVQPAQRTDRAATLTHTAVLARRQVLLQRRHQEAVATARALCQLGRPGGRLAACGGSTLTPGRAGWSR